MDIQEELKKRNIDIEDKDVRNRLIIILMGLVFAIFAGLINYAIGLNPILNIAIVICIFIVLAGVIAYTWEEKKEISAEQEAKVDEEVEKASAYVDEIEQIVASLQSNLQECKKKIEQIEAKIPNAITEKVDVLEKIKERLTSRVGQMNEIIESKDIERFEEIPEIAKSNIVFMNDAANVLITQKKLPDLAFEQLETTINTFVERINSEIKEL